MKRMICSRASRALAISERKKAAEHVAVAACKLLFHVHHVDTGEGRVLGALADASRELQELQFAGCGPVRSCHVGRCAPEDDNRAREPGELQGSLPGVVPGCGLRLLVGAVVLFIEDNEAEVGLGGEKGAPRAYDHAELTFMDSPPLVEFLAGF